MWDNVLKIILFNYLASFGCSGVLLLPEGLLLAAATGATQPQCGLVTLGGSSCFSAQAQEFWAHGLSVAPLHVGSSRRIEPMSPTLQRLS